MNLKNKVALITGGTQGIGAHTALQLSSEGVSVSLVARQPCDSQLVCKIKNNGADCMTVEADLGDADECKRAVQETVYRFGGIDILIHCAGSAAPGSLLNGARDAWYKAFDIHIHAAFHLCREAVPYMKERGG
ncbi:MAG TPA: SDR family oxidoreductase, partial [Flavisolibacter sp.]